MAWRDRAKNELVCRDLRNDLEWPVSLVIQINNRIQDGTKNRDLGVILAPLAQEAPYLNHHLWMKSLCNLAAPGSHAVSEHAACNSRGATFIERRDTSFLSVRRCRETAAVARGWGDYDDCNLMTATGNPPSFWKGYCYCQMRWWTLEQNLLFPFHKVESSDCNWRTCLLRYGPFQTVSLLLIVQDWEYITLYILKSLLNTFIVG